MQALTSILASGFQRGLIELKNSLGLLFGYLFFPLLMLVVMYSLRGFADTGTGFSIGYYAIPGIVALNVLLSGLMGTASTLMQEREDGTLLRAQCLPYGAAAYFVGKLVCQAMLSVATMTIVATVAIIMLGGFQLERLSAYSSLVWIVPLALASMLPLGAIVGAILKNPRQLNLLSLAVMAMTILSGILFPIAVLPSGVQWLGPLLPIYWLGAGMRSALLGEAAAVEIPGLPTALGTFVVLSAWAIAGSVCAILALRRAARKQAGTRIPGNRRRT